MKISKRQVEVKKLRAGMVLAEPIYDIDGKTLFSEGLKLNDKRIERIIRLERSSVIISEEDYLDGEYIQKESYVHETPARSIIGEKAAERKQLLLNETRGEASEVVKDVFQRVIGDGSVKTEKIKKIVEQVISAILCDDKVVLNLSNLSSIDDYMLSHSVNVCVLSLITGIFLGFNQMKLVKLGSGALIHDIGKMLVPEDVFNKPGPLTSDEMKVVQQHTVYGHKILRDTLKFDAETATIALSHHERMDGQGYPHQLTKNEIPIFAKIVSVADVFDALTTDRVYCDRVSYYKGIEYLLKNVGTQFDLDVVKKFVTIIGYYPSGMHVKLNTGDIGQVISRNKIHPVIKIKVDANGNRLQNHYEIDLYKNPSISIIDINIDDYSKEKA